jgi:hypothetical protein
MADMSEAVRRTGRPSKGPRDQVKGLVPTPIARAFKDDAQRHGRTETDHLVAILADYYRLQLEAKSA